MKKTLLIGLLVCLVPIYVVGQVVTCAPPDMKQAVVVFTRTSDEATVDGEYSLAKDKTVRFVKGNLLHQPSTGRWKIAPRAFDIVGGNSNQDPKGRHGTIYEEINGVRTRCTNDGNHRHDYAGWIDLFPWGTSGWYGQASNAAEDSTQSIEWRNAHNPNGKVTANPYNINNSANYILNNNWAQGMTGAYANADWGVFNNVMLGGDAEHVYRTPTREEAVYLLSGRTNARQLRGNACIRLKGRNALGALDASVPDTVINGHIIMPDGWSWADAGLEGLTGRDFKSAQIGRFVYFAENEFTEAEWAFMEAKGAIFLPAAGGMDGNNSTKVNRSGFYWSATPSGTNTSYDLQFGGMDNSWKPMEEKTTKRFYCRAVRLCEEVTDAKKGGAKTPPTCDDYVKKTLDSEGGTISAVQNESDHCKYTLTATPARGYKLAYWIDLYGGKSHENPLEISINLEQPSIVWRAVFVRSNAYVHEWTRDSLYFRSDTTNIFSFAGDGYIETCVEGLHEMDSNDELDSINPGIWGRVTSAGVDQNRYAGKHMHFVMYDACSRPTAVVDTVIPVMIYGDSLASNVHFHADKPHTSVQVFDGASLTIDENTTFSGYLDIHAGGKVIVPAGVTLTVEGIIMRGNGISKKWPQLIVNGHIVNANSNTIYYDYTLDQNTYYPLTLPYNVPCNRVTNPVTRKAASYLSYVYSSEEREAGRDAWQEFDDTAVGAQFEAGKGYAVYAVPAKWRNQKAYRQHAAIMRFPMTVDLSANAEQEKTVATYYNASTALNAAQKNWNLIGNPYMANYTVGTNMTDSTKIVQGYMDWNEETSQFELITDENDARARLRYITYSTDGFYSYQQERLRGFTLKPFNCYFVQTSAGDGLTFAIGDRASSAPRRAWDENSPAEEIETGITLKQAERVDRIGLLFGDYTTAYEINADLVKEFGAQQPMSAYSMMGSTPLAFQALPMEEMSRPIRLGYRQAALTPMTFAFDDSQYDRNAITALWLTDSKTGAVTNLMVDDYTFTPAAAQDDERFYLSAEWRTEEDVTTALDATGLQTTVVRIVDMLGREMPVSDVLPQGVYVLIDSKGQCRKEVVGK